jgi:hypothetical protein
MNPSIKTSPVRSSWTIVGTSPPAFTNAISTFLLLRPNHRRKNKKPAGLSCASGPMSALSNELLCTPHRARPVAMMMMVPMRVRDHSEMAE